MPTSDTKPHRLKADSAHELTPIFEKPQPQTILVILIERFKFRDPYQKLLLEELGERCRITGDDMAFPVLYPFDQPVRAVENHFIRGILNL